MASEQVRYDDGTLDIERGAVSRFVLDGRQWLSPSLDYSFQNFSLDMSQAEVETAIANAFALWASACPNLVFSKIADNGAPFDAASATPPAAGDIRISFGSGFHGDLFPFDGPGGTLAHAFFPPPNGVTAAGDSHFDEDETWALVGAAGGGQPRDLTTVAAHEFGHALGLAHEPSVDAIMNPFYTGPRVLSADDIAAIRTLYCPTASGTPLPLDLVFVLDVTGSMFDDLPQIQASIPTLLQSISNVFPNTRLGLVTFQDFPISPYGTGSDVPFQLVLGLGTPTNIIRSTIQNLVARGGSDFPESQYHALNETISGGTVGFQEGRLPVLLLITDADFHDADTEPGYPGPGRNTAIAALQAAGAKVYTMLSSNPPDLFPGGQSGPASEPVDLDLAMINLEQAADELANVTGGGAFSVGTNSALIAPALNSALAGIAEGATCGDGIREGAEQCDNGDDDLCPGACQANCLCTFTTCGNNIQEGGEQCDGFDDAACSGLCTSSCLCESIPVCGNNIREGAEECDGVDATLCPGKCTLDCVCELFADGFESGNTSSWSVTIPGG